METQKMLSLPKSVPGVQLFGEQCKTWHTNKIRQVPLFFSLLFFFGKVPGQLTEHLGGGHNVHTDLCCSDRISQRMLDDLKRDLETLNIVVRK